MNQPEGKVIAIDRDTVTVAVTAAPACARCAAGKGCGAGLLGASGAQRMLTLPLPAGLQLRPGEQVTLRLTPARLLQASLLAYGLPLVAMLLLPWLAERVAGPLSDAGLAGIALAGLAAAVACVRRYLHGTACLQQFTPGIAGRVTTA
jgi:sigma-E factor negative regulatory protein RseC